MRSRLSINGIASALNRVYGSSKRKFKVLDNDTLEVNGGLLLMLDKNGRLVIRDNHQQDTKDSKSGKNLVRYRDWIAGLEDNPNSLNKLKGIGWSYKDGGDESNSSLISMNKMDISDIVNTFFILFTEVKPLVWDGASSFEEPDTDSPQFKARIHWANQPKNPAEYPAEKQKTVWEW